MEFSSQLDIQAEYRSAAHMIFKCLGFVDPDLVNSIDTHRIRQFSRYNENSWEEFAVLVEPIFSAGSHMEFLNESSFTEIYYSKYLKKVIGVLNILNRVKKAVVVCENYDGPDKIVLIAEIPGGIIKAFSLDFNMELQFPICNISKRPPSPEDIAREFYNVVTNSVYIDAIQAPFLKKLQEIANKYGVVSEQSLAEYRSALAEFLKTISVLNQNPISVEKAFVVLDQLQFLNILAGYNGKRLDDDIVNKKIIVITENAMKNVLACR